MITPKQIALLHHTLGITPERREPYRNHFVAGPGHHDQADLEALELAGLMERGNTPSFCEKGDVVFRCTETGRRHAIDSLPPRQKRSRYEEYLRSEYSESFAEWLGIDVPKREYGRSYYGGENNIRLKSSRAIGEWKPTLKEAKASYKAALRSQRERCAA